MISRFFIDRPIFASVLSIVITLAGGVAIFSLPIAQYPQISPPTVQVDCNYPGASAQVVSETVATPIEQQVNGVENMLYMSSQCTNDGSYNLTVTFKHGVDLNMAQVLVQNRVSLAIPNLPEVLKQTGVTTRKRSPDILLAIGINSPSGRYDQLYLSNYAALRVKDELARLPGISDVTMLGQRDYSMRIWVDPEQLSSRNMAASDVVMAIREQNLQVATGQIGQEPIPQGQQIQVPLSTLGRLVTVEQFENIIVKSTPDGRVTKIKDVAKVELGAKNQDISSRLDGSPTVSMAIFQLPDANALDTADLVRAKMEELKQGFPDGVTYQIRYDTTPFIRESIQEVFKTLQEAIILVAVVVLLFLQNWRSAIIPLIAVPVAIVGTFAALAVFGFSINNLTLFGLVLAIGIVVDDAIVVVEAVEHHIEHGLSPRLATIRAMDEVSGPVIAIGLVLTAVFVPCAFITGIVGQFFRQFALTIAISTLISAFNSLTLSPALAALLLRPRGQGKDATALPRVAYAVAGALISWQYLLPKLAPLVKRLPLHQGANQSLTNVLNHPRFLESLAIVLGLIAGWLISKLIDRVLVIFFGLFNKVFGFATTAYTRTISLLLRGSLFVLIGYGGLMFLTYREFSHTPRGFIPSQDMGYLLVNVQLPDSASAERTSKVMAQIEKIALDLPGVAHTQSMAGQSLLLSAFGSNFGSMFVILDPFAKRLEPEKYGEAIANTLRKKFGAQIYDAQVTVFGPPPVRGVGRAGGYRIMVEDRGDQGANLLQGQTENLVEKGNQQPTLMGNFAVFRANVPQLYVDVDRTACMTKQVRLQDLFSTLQVYLGSLYVNDFNLFGRTWQVVVQAESKYRNKLEDVHRLKVRNALGDMVPLGTLASVREVNGPLILTRYNMYPAASINGNAAPGVSSGQAINIMEGLAKKELLPSMSTEWTELAFLELQAGNTAMVVFGFAVVMVFLVLAAQYESWSLPLAVILVVPMCLLSAVTGVNISGTDINIFTQIGFVVLVGLASKNAILIVEFAKANRESGSTRRQATLEACRLRLRPIVMTSLAFILGVVPLMITHGAGAEMRRILGTTVFSGMLGVTVFGIFLTPVFFFVIDWLGETKFMSSPLMRGIGAVTLDIFALRFVRRVGRRILRRGQKVTVTTPLPAIPSLPTVTEPATLEPEVIHTEGASHNEPAPAHANGKNGANGHDTSEEVVGTAANGESGDASMKNGLHKLPLGNHAGQPAANGVHNTTPGDSAKKR
ncbi:efflux RND transporter permease subunit [Singulisphaera sp. PoT]|uniref:efflux RND transporter permease subunit n=1 Tax=Singulisphaera sp. PoT TaxID=3411797 RepID=UPI003BF5FB4A